MARLVFVWMLALAAACGRPAPPVPATPPDAFAGPLRLLSHADDPLELLLFERPDSRSFIAAVASLLGELNRSAEAAGSAPIGLTVLSWRRDRHDRVPLTDPATPVARLEVDVRFDVWLQDFAEISSAGGETILLDPRRASGGLERVVPLLADRWGGRWLRLARDAAGASNGAGNVEVLPDDLLLLGTTAGPGLASFLFERGYRDRHVRVDTGFLAIGHVDEIVSHVVTGPGPCDYALVHASPALGLTHASPDPAPPRWLRKRLGRDRFLATQRTLEQRIAAAVTAIRARAAASGCAPPPSLALPVLFDCKGGPASPRACRTSHPNPVNMTVLRRHLLIPDPGYPPFGEAIARVLRGAGQIPHLLPAGFYHERLGGIHCATNVRRDPSGRRESAIGSHRAAFPIPSAAAGNQRGNLK